MAVGLEWYTVAIAGHSAGLPCTTQQWLTAWDMAVHRQLPEGTRGQGLARRRDHGRQPTATTCRQACHLLGNRQAVTSDHHPQGNADTARMRRTLTEACRWRHEWTGPFPAASAPET